MITRVIKPRRISIYFPSPEQQDKKRKKRDIKLQPRNALWVQKKILMCNTQETTTFNQEKCCSSGESDMDISDMTRKFSDALTPPMHTPPTTPLPPRRFSRNLRLHHEGGRKNNWQDNELMAKIELCGPPTGVKIP